jgi:hypothetical protein
MAMDRNNVLVDGADPQQARALLEGVLAELDWRASVVVQAGGTEWTGPKLRLRIKHVDRLLTDRQSRALAVDQILTRILRIGRKLGVTGVARGSARTADAIYGADQAARTQLATGVPIAYEHSDNRTQYAAA